MGIGEDIKQTRFRNEWQKGMINLLYTYNYISYGLKGYLEDYDLSHQQFNVLRILNGSHPQPLSTQEIRNRMLDKASDASRIVDRLIAKELLMKKGCDKDKRLVDVTITDKGKELVQGLIEKEDTMIMQVMGNLTEADAKKLNELLDKVRETKK
jgi:MarR family transcriptional regulator, 2-MHQ and catechol-resistance regulon repressor